jgi:hypothetical protein
METRAMTKHYRDHDLVAGPHRRLGGDRSHRYRVASSLQLR